MLVTSTHPNWAAVCHLTAAYAVDGLFWFSKTFIQAIVLTKLIAVIWVHGDTAKEKFEQLLQRWQFN